MSPILLTESGRGLDGAPDIVDYKALAIGWRRDGCSCNREETALLGTIGCHGAELEGLAGGISLASFTAISDAVDIRGCGDRGGLSGGC